MQIRFSAALASAITMTFGFITIAGLLVSDDLGLSPAFVDALQGATSIILQLVTIVVALTVIIGIINLLYVHLRRITARQKGAVYGLIMILSYALVIGTYVASRETSMILLETVQFSVEASLAGLLLFALVYGAYRLTVRSISWVNLLFIVVLLLVLVGTLPLGEDGIFRQIRDWLFAIPVSAGARGILLGFALATIVTGLRVLVGVDRSYRE